MLLGIQESVMRECKGHGVMFIPEGPERIGVWNSTGRCIESVCDSVSLLSVVQINWSR